MSAHIVYNIRYALSPVETLAFLGGFILQCVSRYSTYDPEQGLFSFKPELVCWLGVEPQMHCIFYTYSSRASFLSMVIMMACLGIISPVWPIRSNTLTLLPTSYAPELASWLVDLPPAR